MSMEDVPASKSLVGVDEVVGDGLEALGRPRVAQLRLDRRDVDLGGVFGGGGGGGVGEDVDGGGAGARGVCQEGRDAVQGFFSACGVLADARPVVRLVERAVKVEGIARHGPFRCRGGGVRLRAPAEFGEALGVGRRKVVAGVGKMARLGCALGFCRDIVQGRARGLTSELCQGVCIGGALGLDEWACGMEVGLKRSGDGMCGRGRRRGVPRGSACAPWGALARPSSKKDALSRSIVIGDSPS